MTSPGLGAADPTAPHTVDDADVEGDEAEERDDGAQEVLQPSVDVREELVLPQLRHLQSPAAGPGAVVDHLHRPVAHGVGDGQQTHAEEDGEGHGPGARHVAVALDLGGVTHVDVALERHGHRQPGGHAL